MSFHEDTAAYRASDTGAAAPSGSYRCRLTEIAKGFRPDFNNPAEQQPKFDWFFETLDVCNSDGRAYRFRLSTNTRFGNDQAGFTRLLDQMLGKRLTRTEFAALDLADLKRRPWQVAVEVVTGSRGVAFNHVLWVRPGLAAPSPSAPRRRAASPDDHARAVP